MTIRRSTRDIELGFGRYDSEITDQYYRNKPQVQVLKRREVPKEKQVKYCSNCNQKMQWLESSRRFICYSCGVTYSELFDTPLSSIDQQIRPLQDNSPYSNDNRPYFKNIEVNRRLEGEEESDTIQETRSYHNGRIKHIKLKPGISPASYSIREDLSNNDQR